MINQSLLITTLAILFVAEIMCACVGQSADPRYFNEVAPGTTPRVFAPGKISLPQQFEFGSVFSEAMDEFYYGIDSDGKAETRQVKYKNGKWSDPARLLFDSVYSYNDPFLSYDNTKLFVISDRPINGHGPKKDYDIWFMKRTDNGWSTLNNAGPVINTEKNEYYISFTSSGKMYYSSNGKNSDGSNNYDIYAAQMKGESFQEPLRLPSEINTANYEADVFVSQDESFVIFSTDRPEGLGRGDLYVSFRQFDGTWTPAKSLGSSVNTETNDFCPYVSPDGKYLFYSSRGDIYWVSIDILNKLR